MAQVPTQPQGQEACRFLASRPSPEQRPPAPGRPWRWDRKSSKLGVPGMVPPLSVLSCRVTLGKLSPYSGPWFQRTPQPQTGFWGAIRFPEGVPGLSLEVGVQPGEALGPKASFSQSSFAFVCKHRPEHVRCALTKEHCRLERGGKPVA